MNKREEWLLANIGLRYHGAVEIEARHLKDVTEAMGLGILEVGGEGKDATLYLSEDWFAKLNDIDVKRVSQRIVEEMEGVM